MFVQAALRSVRYTPVPMDLGNLLYIIDYRLVKVLTTIRPLCSVCGAGARDQVLLPLRGLGPPLR